MRKDGCDIKQADEKKLYHVVDNSIAVGHRDTMSVYNHRISVACNERF